MKDSLIAGGWRHEPHEGFIAALGGLWHRSVDGADEFGFIAEAMHANRNGVVHGGMLMTFVDRAFGQTARRVGQAERAATVSLSHQFMAPLPIGGFATIEPVAAKITTRFAFLQGTVFCDGTAIMSAQGVWRLARPDG